MFHHNDFISEFLHSCKNVPIAFKQKKTRQLSKPNPNSNSIELGLRLDIVPTANPHHTTQNYSETSRQARKLKFGIYTH